MRELGRLRELTFRAAGEGTGRRRDLDDYDACYRHLVLWDEAQLQVVGAYRLGEAAAIVESRGQAGLYTSTLFEFGEGLRALLPQALELGRSFVQPRYQGLRALEYLWYGIGAYVAARPGVRYLFGPVSVSADLPLEARRLLAYFYRRHFGSAEPLATARHPFEIAPADEAAFAALLPGEDYARDFRSLKQRLAELGAGVPMLYKQYTDLCEPGGARFLAFGVDAAFSDCVDGLVLVDLQRLKLAKRERYLGAGRRLSAGAADDALPLSA